MSTNFDHLKRQCAICYKIVLRDNTLYLPTTTEYRVCYPCFTYWVEDIPHDVLINKIIKNWHNKVYKPTNE